MALSLGKLTLIVGAGFVGSVLAQEGRISNVTEFFSGALKIAFKQLSDSATSSSKPNNDSLVQQVNSLRQELQLLASNRSMMIVTGSQSGSGKYGVVIIVVVAGYGYTMWKGWNLSDMMFATRRSLNDACASVARQLEDVYSSLSAAKKHLSSRIDRVDCKIDECLEDTAATKVEITELHGDVKLIGANVESVHKVVQSLETKICRIEGKQSLTNIGVGKLVALVRMNLEQSKRPEQIEAPATNSSRPVVKLPPESPARAESLPAQLSSPEPSTPSPSDKSLKKQATFPPINPSKVTPSGLKDLNDITQDDAGPANPTTHRSSDSTEESSSGNSSGIAGVFGGKSVGFGIGFGGASVLTRTRSVMQSFK
ncbi:uncharacterized protein LOC127241538 [Andrographis paniculata]|uniref:uncharacterized protein LOC127241538 n=1 Tax=Andrographis paniculata TaxID=175694 RepID=UPI0021E773DA|nr:uncharacterized protein LOC127241538 [Andrographis paniculata]